MKPFLNLVSADEARKIIFSLPCLNSELVPLGAVTGRRLARNFVAPAALPGFTRSTMDGFAVRARDVFGAGEGSAALLRVVGQCHMGQTPAFELNPGETAAIATGAPLPRGADAVVMIEHSREAGEDLVEIIRSVAPGDNMVEWDEDAVEGETLIRAGAALGPAQIGALAAFGVGEVPVFRQPRVAIFASGDEIVPLTETPPPGKLRDVNSWSVAALCRANGALPSLMGIISDERDRLANALKKRLENFDVIIVSGGSSAGARDHTVAAFLSLPDARILIHGVAISPGKPFILASAANKCLVGLPGHVTSALICARVFLSPLLDHLQGLAAPEPRAWIDATLTKSLASAKGREEYIRCSLEKREDRFFATPITAPSAVLSGLLAADGLIVCPENSEGLAAGHNVKVFPFNC